MQCGIEVTLQVPSGVLALDYRNESARFALPGIIDAHSVAFWAHMC